MKKLPAIFIFIFLNCFSALLPAQKSKADSLLAKVNYGPHDSDRVNAMNALAWMLRINEKSKASQYALKALALSEKINFKLGQAIALNTLGVISYNKGNSDLSLQYHLRSLKIREETGDKKLISNACTGIGNVYLNRGDYSMALQFYFRSLKLDEELGRKGGIAIKLGNIGIAYKEQGDMAKALEYYFKALKIDEEQKNESGIARHLSNIGIINNNQKKHKEALAYHFRALAINEKLNDKKAISAVLGNIGNVYDDQADYANSLAYFLRALKIKEEINDRYGVCIYEENIGAVYLYTNKLPEAENYLTRALALSDSLVALDLQKSSHFYLYELYERTHSYKKAYEHYVKFGQAKDSLFNDESAQEIVRAEMNFEFEKKESAARAEQQKNAGIAKAESKKQKIVIGFSVFGLLIGAVLAVFIFRALKVTRKQKNIIEQQKNFVDEKQKEILDSIRYARRIQTALITSEAYIDKNLKRLKLIKL